MERLEFCSFTLSELSTIKFNVTDGRSYAERISFALAIRLVQHSADAIAILNEIDHLEGLNPHTATKPASQFRRQPLHPFWHKHFFAPRHILRNVGDRWRLTHEGNKDLDNLIGQIADHHGHVESKWPRILAHKLVIGGFEDRAEAKRLTGDWIIFAKYEGNNYYLDLATHTEGCDGEKLMSKLRDGCKSEYPFLFDES